MRDFEFYVRDNSGSPIYLVQHHESHKHNGMCPHEHWIDLREVTMADSARGGNFNKFREDVRSASWA